MPKLRSSRKRLRQARKARMRNRTVRSLMRNTLKKVRIATDRAQAEALLPQTMSAIDRSAQKGVIHKNAAARYKSKLVHQVGAMEA